MAAYSFQVYIDWDDQSIRAVSAGLSCPARAKLTESLWTLQADNADDALRRSVQDGYVMHLIETTEESLREDKAFITARPNPYDGTMTGKRMDIRRKINRLHNLHRTQDHYAPVCYLAAS